MNKLKAKASIRCFTCCQPLKRVKTFLVHAGDKEAAAIELDGQLEQWKKSLAGENCRTCQSIINDVAQH